MGKPRLTLMVGLPASGKSTYAHKLAEETNSIVLSSDKLRKELLGAEEDQSNNDLVFKTLYLRAKEYLSNGQNVIIDATNINMKDRKKTLNNFSNMDIERYCVVMATPVEICFKNDKNRERTVGEEVIKKFLYRFEVPMYYEGFDEISVIVWSINFYETRENLFNIMNGFNQKNPHHTKTLDKHCEETARLVSEKTMDVELIESAKFHDFGKLYTQTFGEDGVGHYYSHHNVGAYCLLSAYTYVPFTLKQIFYVNFHMAPFNWKEEKTREKYKNLFGEELYNNLLLLHECDKMAK